MLPSKLLRLLRVLVSFIFFLILELVSFAGCPGLVVQAYIFEGVRVDSSLVASGLGYPPDWSYRQVGGGGPLQPTPWLRGRSASTFVATRPDGSKVVLKKMKYPNVEGMHPASQVKTLNKMRDLFQKIGLEIEVAHANVSARNSAVIEIEYHPGQDLLSFIGISDPTLSIQLTKFFNDQAQKLRDHLGPPAPPNEAKPGDLTRVDFKLDGLDAALKADNVLVTTDPNRPGHLRLVLIDSD